VALAAAAICRISWTY